MSWQHASNPIVFCPFTHPNRYLHGHSQMLLVTTNQRAALWWVLRGVEVNVHKGKELFEDVVVLQRLTKPGECLLAGVYGV